MTSQAPTYAGSVEARVQQLEDTEEVRRLLLDYCRAMDAKDLAACSELFAQDGELVVPHAAPRGPEAIRAVLEGMRGSHIAAEPGGDFHISTNHIINVDGDTATSTSFFLYAIPGDDGSPETPGFGHYEDVLCRENGRWRFLSRKVLPDIQREGYGE